MQNGLPSHLTPWTLTLHQLLKTRAVYSGGAGGVRAPPEFGGSKKGRVCLL